MKTAVMSNAKVPVVRLFTLLVLLNIFVTFCGAIATSTRLIGIHFSLQFSFNVLKSSVKCHLWNRIGDPITSQGTVEKLGPNLPKFP